MGGARIRIGAVSYLNARPLTEGLSGSSDLDVEFGLPAEIAVGLRVGHFDLGLVPSIELARQPTLDWVPGLGVASDGPVWSVLLTLATAPGRVRRLSLDPSSRTSQVLARIVLERRFGARPAVVVRSPDAGIEREEADASLIIGDDALAVHASGVPRLDLAEAWTEWTGLPMVFAVWAGQRASRSRWGSAVPRLSEALNLGLARRAALCEAAQGDLGVDARTLRVYLGNRIRYRLGPREERGLRHYLQLASPYLRESS